MTYELRIDASHCKVDLQAAGARGGNHAMVPTKRGLTPRNTWPWIGMEYRSELLFRKVAELIAKKFAP